jgi:hypothetical protein
MTDLKPIVRKPSLPEMMQSTLKEGWIFEKPIEKIIIIGSVVWTVFSIIKYAISFFL